jgi:PadR family transcriptional regulator PadR
MEADRTLTNLRKGIVESCVLAAMRGTEAYGVDLARRLTAAGILASEGTLYPVLARLRTANLVTTRWEESPSGPPRRYYRLTDAGTAAVATFTRTWTTLSASVDALLEEKP